jgi:Fic family protein
LDEKSVKDRPMRDVLVTIQHERTFRDLLRRTRSPITLSTILELHEEVFRGVIADAGHWRTINVKIRGAAAQPPRMEKVVILLEKLLEDYSRRRMEGDEIFELASRFHHGFEIVHPFSDGNGRIGRLLLNLHFLKCGWPPIHILPVDTDEYLDALNQASHGNYNNLIFLFSKLMGSSLLDLLDSVGTADDELLDLREIARGVDYSQKYLSLRCSQGEIPGIRVMKWWKTSARALNLYMEKKGRKSY